MKVPLKFTKLSMTSPLKIFSFIYSIINDWSYFEYLQMQGIIMCIFFHRSRSYSRDSWSDSNSSIRSRVGGGRGSRSYSRSRSRSRSSSIGSKRRRSRRDSRSPSIRRRRGSPSHLDKRRITRWILSLLWAMLYYWSY